MKALVDLKDSVFNEVAGLKSAALLGKRPQRRCFPVNFVEILRIRGIIYLFCRAFSGDYFYINWMKTCPDIVTDIKMIPIEAILVT